MDEQQSGPANFLIFFNLDEEKEAKHTLFIALFSLIISTPFSIVLNVLKSILNLRLGNEVNNSFNEGILPPPTNSICLTS